MKVHITENVEQAIENFNMIPVIYGKVDLTNVPDNSATDIYIENLDQIQHDFIEEFFTKLRSKVRKNGRILISGTELSILARNVLSNNLSSQEFNNIILSGKRGLHKVNDISNLLKKVGMLIEEVSISGNSYAIKSSRS